MDIDENMITIMIVDREGVEHEVPCPIDMNLNLMEICKMNELGVEGTCGGMALCASCQVYIETDHHLRETSEAEIAMLDQAFHTKSNSRLGCQLKLNSEMNGLKVTIAPE
jgi:ferredoxin-2, mitochondrial